MNLIEHNEEWLLLELRKGNKRAFEGIFNRYWYTLFKVAYSRIKRREEAEEIVQNIFTALWKNRDTALISNLSYYLYASVTKGVISKIREKLVQKKYWDYYTRFLPEYSMLTDEKVEFEDLNSAMENALLELPQKSQQVFKLNRLQGLSITEIAQFLKMPRRTVEHHLTKSLRTLRIRLKNYILFLLIIIHSALAC